jgi:hypothetical protein
MLKEGVFFGALDKYGEAFCVLKVFGDKSHSLKLIVRDTHSGKLVPSELHGDSTRDLYKFLKKHFENNQKFTHEEYLEYVEDMKAEDCPEELIDSEDKWRADLIAEFGADDE